MFIVIKEYFWEYALRLSTQMYLDSKLMTSKKNAYLCLSGLRPFGIFIFKDDDDTRLRFSFYLDTLSMRMYIRLYVVHYLQQQYKTIINIMRGEGRQPSWYCHNIVLSESLTIYAFHIISHFFLHKKSFIIICILLCMHFQENWEIQN